MSIKLLSAPVQRGKGVVNKLLMGLLLLVVLATVADVAYANVRRTIPDEDPFAPQYAAGFSDNEIGWVSLVFYRQPSCIPQSVNLRIYDLPLTYGGGAFACPLTVKGFVIYESNPPDLLDPATWQNFPPPNPPQQYELHQVAAVPMWFVTWDDFWSVYRNGPMTISDFQRMPSLRKGAADFYHETWHFPAGVKVATRSVEAYGTFPNGSPVKSFRFHASFQSPPNESFGHGTAHGAGGIVFK